MGAKFNAILPVDQPQAVAPRTRRNCRPAGRSGERFDQSGDLAGLQVEHRVVGPRVGDHEQHAGLAAAAANGRKGGRPRKIDDADAAKARKLREKGIAATDIAKMLRVSRATVYRYLADDAAA